MVPVRLVGGPQDGATTEVAHAAPALRVWAGSGLHAHVAPDDADPAEAGREVLAYQLAAEQPGDGTVVYEWTP